MKNERKDTHMDLTKDLYLRISTDKATQISELRQEKDQITSSIKGYIEYLKELSVALKEIKDRIKVTKKALNESRRRKWAIKRELSVQNRYARKLNRSFTRGDETIELKDFYTLEEQKIR